MSDDKRVFALLNTVANYTDRLRQSIDGLRQLHDRLKDSQEAFINLIAQLTALKSNLGEMQDWMNYAIQDLHPQLLSDLDVLMDSCGALVRSLDRLIAQLRQPDHDNVDFAIKMKLAVGARSMRRLQNVAKRQADAVNLLLAACKCHTTAQRKILLHKSRQIRKDGNSSMSTLARTSKWDGRCIETLARISRMVQWFRLIFYIKLLRKGEEPADREQEDLDVAAAYRSQAIDRELEEEAAWLRRETKIILVGMQGSGKELITRQMQVLYSDGYPQDQRVKYRYAVRSTIRVLLHAISDLIKDTGINLPKSLSLDYAVLLNELETIDNTVISPEAVIAAENIWNSEAFSAVYVRNFEIDFPQYAPYFAKEIRRIATEDYIPSEADIIRLNNMDGGIKELRFSWDELDVHLFNISGWQPDNFRRRWFHQLENATAIVYTVDVSTYDRPWLAQSTESQLLDDFASFDTWVNSPKFARSSIILLLNNFTRFREKLPHCPLSTFFADYTPGPDPEVSARQYILKRFKDVNRNKLSIYSFWVDLDMGDNTHLYAAVKKTLTHIQQRKARSQVLSDGGGLVSAMQSRATDVGASVRSGTALSHSRTVSDV
ncbi:guanine nucleotide-binding protein-like protein alpha-3 subunit [Sporormia fimetaria CBS 119925]|uniref:Guanine nucleotide-binding protein-like protein alpha-3 subunit n=1 Tax=Sporormia fimetaria CBS 119925 TaxID=1340428 RepID=A0A6A6VHD7_9PLEO|nr:guanine nucleotide-binding protein-like protein alpha-3 subunit [Sporormia fimetaria CBS 119925]